MSEPQQHFHLHTLGCPKNQVDSDKIAGTLLDDGLVPTDDVASADLVVVNTCAFKLVQVLRIYLNNPLVPLLGKIIAFNL